MLQLPLLGSGGVGPVKGSGSDVAGGDIGLEGLLAGAEGEMSAFSGELQAMLSQLSPQMLKRLEEMLAGGMTLPQAAKSILVGAGYGDQGKLFEGLLEEGMATVAGNREPGDALGGSGSSATLPRLVGDLKLANVDAGIANGDRTSAAMASAAPLAGMAAAVDRLPSQLATGLLEMGVPQQLGTKAWGAAITDRVLWMIQGEQQVAKLRLNPPNLGPLEVRVTVHQDQASVAFLAQHAVVREALEAALPRLREMFDQQSLELVRADVSDPGAQQGEGSGNARAGSGANAGAADWDADSKDTGTEGAEVSSSLTGSGQGLVDLFA